MKPDFDKLNEKQGRIQIYLPLVAYLCMFVVVLYLRAHFPFLIENLYLASSLPLLLIILSILIFKNYPRIPIRKGYLPPSFFSYFFKVNTLLLLFFLCYLFCLLNFLSWIVPSGERDIYAAWISDFLVQLRYAAFFPWPIFPLLVLGFAKRFYLQRKAVSLSALIKPIIPHRKVGVVSIGSHIYFRYLNMLALNLSVVLMGLTLSQWVLSHSTQALTEALGLKSLLFMSLISLPLSLFPKVLMTGYQKWGFLRSYSCVFLYIIASMLLVFLGVDYGIAKVHRADWLQSFHTALPALQVHLLPGDAVFYFSAAWWMGLGLGMTWTIARYSTGRRYLEILFSIIPIPLLFFICLSLPMVQSAMANFLAEIQHYAVFRLVSAVFVLCCIGGYYAHKRNFLGFCSRSQRELSPFAFKTIVSNLVFMWALFWLLRFQVMYYFFYVIVVMAGLYGCVAAFSVLASMALPLSLKRLADKV